MNPPAGKSARSVRLVLSIDTEEDNWRPTRDDIAVENIQQLPKLQKFLRSFGAVPTYFVTYQVLNDPAAADIIRELHLGGGAEVAAQLHPWNTPPFREELTDTLTMTKNLPQALQKEKLTVLTEKFIEVIGQPPRAIRIGRYGFGQGTARALLDCGYEVDSSVTPFVDWRSTGNGPNYWTAPLDAYRIGSGDITVPDPKGALIELPISCGFNRMPFSFWSRVHAVWHRPPLRQLGIPGLAARMHLLRKSMLSPETASRADLLRLAHNLVRMRCPVVHAAWHSPTLVPGLSPFAKEQRDVENLYATVGELIERVGEASDVVFASVTDAALATVPART